MKKYISILVFSLIVGISGCKEEDVPEKFLEVDVGSLSLNFDAERGSQTVTIRANVDFGVTSSNPEWCSTVVMNYATDNLGISVLRNNEFDGRQATITISADGMDDIKIAVTQSGLMPYFSVVQENVLIQGRLEFTLDIDANFPVSFELPEWISENENNHWLSGAQKYSFDVAQYLEDTPLREGSVKISPATSMPGIQPVSVSVMQISEKRVIKTKGNSIQFSFPMTETNEVVIENLKKANISTVHFNAFNNWDGSVATGQNRYPPSLIKDLEDNGIGIWWMFIGSVSGGGLPESWKAETLNPCPSCNYYSYHNDEFVNWHVERVKRVIADYPSFIGIGVAESFFHGWKTVDGQNGHYTDVSPVAREKFTKQYLNLDRETLTFAEIRNDYELYQKWQDFRVDAIINFNKKIKEAVKSTNPDVLFASWGMGESRGTNAEIREHYGLDQERIVREVEPDIFVVQTSPSDWQNGSLQPQYVEEYQYIIEALQKANPKVFLAVQADIASHSWIYPTLAVRNGAWWKRFMEISFSIGFYHNTAYEYNFYRRQGQWIE